MRIQLTFEDLTADELALVVDIAGEEVTVVAKPQGRFRVTTRRYEAEQIWWPNHLMAYLHGKYDPDEIGKRLARQTQLESDEVEWVKRFWTRLQGTNGEGSLTSKALREAFPDLYTDWKEAAHA